MAASLLLGALLQQRRLVFASPCTAGELLSRRAASLRSCHPGMLRLCSMPTWQPERNFFGRARVAGLWARPTLRRLRSFQAAVTGTAGSMASFPDLTFDAHVCLSVCVYADQLWPGCSWHARSSGQGIAWQVKLTDSSSSPGARDDLTLSFEAVRDPAYAVPVAWFTAQLPDGSVCEMEQAMHLLAARGAQVAGIELSAHPQHGAWGLAVQPCTTADHIAPLLDVADWTDIPVPCTPWLAWLCSVMQVFGQYAQPRAVERTTRYEA